MIKYQDLNFDQRQRVDDMVFNAVMTRTSLIKALLDGTNRDLNHECQYPSTDQMDSRLYKDMYERESIGVRVVELLPKECWRQQPEVYEDEDVEATTAFEQAWKDLDKMLRGESWFRDEEGSPIWEVLRRVDILSGIGRYGVLLLGLDDGADPMLPAKRRQGQRLLYVRAFDEYLADITARESDKNNPRYGMPTQYSLTLDDPVDSQGLGVTQGSINVHWTRVLHVADNLGSSEIFGVPRMRPVWNRLLDLRKLYGGSAEMFWKGAFPGIALETHPQLGADVEVDTTTVKEQMEYYMNGLQRYLNLIGMSAKTIAPAVADPSSHIDREIEAICILLGCPKRIFMGSERGELASGQDDDSWNARIEDRRKNYVTPRLIVPFADRLIWLGVLPEPAEEGYSVSWPDISQESDQEKADVAVKRTEAMAKYVGGGLDVLVTPVDFLTRMLGMDEQEAQEIVDAAIAHIEEGGMPKDEDELEIESKELDIEAKRKSIDQIGKEPPRANPNQK